MNVNKQRQTHLAATQKMRRDLHCLFMLVCTRPLSTLLTLEVTVLCLLLSHFHDSQVFVSVFSSVYCSCGLRLETQCILQDCPIGTRFICTFFCRHQWRRFHCLCVSDNTLSFYDLRGGQRSFVSDVVFAGRLALIVLCEHVLVYEVMC